MRIRNNKVSIRNLSMVRVTDEKTLNMFIPIMTTPENLGGKLLFFQQHPIKDDYAIIELDESKTQLRLIAQRETKFKPNDALFSEMEKQYKEHNDISLIIDVSTSKPIFDLIERKSIEYFYSRPPKLQFSERVLVTWKVIPENSKTEYTNIGCIIMNIHNLPLIALWKNMGFRFIKSESNPEDSGSEFAIRLLAEYYNLLPTYSTQYKPEKDVFPGRYPSKVEEFKIEKLWELYIDKMDDFDKIAEEKLIKKAKSFLLSDFVKGKIKKEDMYTYKTVDIDTVLDREFKITRAYASMGQLHLVVATQWSYQYGSKLPDLSAIKELFPKEYVLDIYNQYAY